MMLKKVIIINHLKIQLRNFYNSKMNKNKNCLREVENNKMTNILVKINKKNNFLTLINKKIKIY